MIKEILLFSGGILVGAAAGIIGTKLILEKKIDKKYQDKADKEILEAMEKHFKDGGSKTEPVKEPDKDSLSDAKVASVAEKAVQKEQEKKNQKINYTAYSENGVEHPDDMIVKPKKTIVEPEDIEDDEEDEIEKFDRQEEENYIKGLRDSERWSRERMNRPKIIKRENYGEDPLLEQAELYYYQQDDTLTFANDGEEITDEELHVGDCLTKYGFKHNQEKTIYVRNTYLGYDFEITKRFGSYVPDETG